MILDGFRIEFDASPNSTQVARSLTQLGSREDRGVLAP
jgi:hypothetical protein